MPPGRLVSEIFGTLITIIVFIFIILILSGKVRVAVVEGISMEPTLHTGDMVVIEKKPPDEIEVGDVVVYKSGNRYIIHRVIDKFRMGGTMCFVIKGDNNPIPDIGSPRCKGKGVPYDEIVGVVYSVKPGVPLKVPYLGGISVLLRG